MSSNISTARYIEAVLPVPLRRSFTYRIPPELLGEISKAALPAGINSERGVRPKRRKAVRLLPGTDEKLTLTEQQRSIVDLLEANGGEMLFTDIIDRLKTTASPLNTLARRGVLET